MPPRLPENKDVFNRGTDLLAKPVFPVFRDSTGKVVEPRETGGFPVAAGYADDASRDAFGRFRVSDPYQIYEAAPLYVPTTLRDVTGGGGSITRIGITPVYTMSVPAVNGAFAASQSRMHLPYTPGKSQSILITAVLGTNQTGVFKRVGYFDESDGLMFRQSPSGMEINERSSASGSIVDRVTPQRNWNIDKVDGTGPSGIRVDFSKAQIYTIDFQWLGVGRVRFGLNVDGVPVPVHEVSHANRFDTVYMTSPHLPIRYEIVSIGGGTGGSMRRICAAALTEGGSFPAGDTFLATLGTALNQVTTREAILGVRHLLTFGGRPNNRKIFLEDTLVSSSSYSIFYEVERVRNPTTVGGVWTPVNAFSSAEYSLAPSYTGGTPTIMLTGYVAASTQGSQSTSGSDQRAFTSTRMFDNVLVRGPFSNVSDLFILYATSVTGSSTDVGASMRWIEYD